MNCQEAIDIMEDAVEGRLQPALRAPFGEHMTECPSCGTYFQHLRLTRQALQSLRQGGGNNPRREELVEEFRKEFDRDDSSREPSS